MLNAAIHARNSRASLDYKAPGQKIAAKIRSTVVWIFCDHLSLRTWNQPAQAMRLRAFN